MKDRRKQRQLILIALGVVVGILATLYVQSIITKHETTKKQMIECRAEAKKYSGAWCLVDYDDNVRLVK